MADNDGPVTVEDLPLSFQVKYLRQSDARGLWGIKHTRKPVDLMVAAAKALPPGQILPIVKLLITVDGVHLETVNHGTKKDEFEHIAVFFNIESISYGVQDLVYTRVFSMIIVKENADVKGLNPFECHAFVCESRAPLVPVYAFGETETYEILHPPKGGIVERTLNLIRNILGVCPIPMNGRGFFQYSFGFLPKRAPLNIVFGAPIEVTMNNEPSNEEVDAVHKTFVKALVDLFDTHKHKYVKDPENAHLELF